MEIAIISDIHGNLVALEEVMSELSERKIEHVLCLGDVAAGGPQPREVLDLLRAEGCPVIMGNTDAILLQPLDLAQPQSSAKEGNTFSYYVQEAERWSAQQLTESDRDYIRTFQDTYAWPLPQQKTLLGYHGSPRSFRERLLATTPDEQLATAFDGFQAHIFAGGHTHIPMLRRYRDVIVLNPGSVGMAIDPVAPFESIHNVAWAEYAVLNIGDDYRQSMSIELCHVSFDLQKFIESMFTAGMPHAEWWAKEWRSTSLFAKYSSPRTDVRS